ncbi:anthranilate synthase component I [Sporolactobacillus pectinivorans]|uniref:anthranilate synthase component I n=1 Tax=Sporolactobacillus pectinivorans TaxID=1591408 RepID=UPI000C25B546|nr:anthranilate synthase component I [Sporolactobacillus pectinivorans]
MSLLSHLHESKESIIYSTEKNLQIIRRQSAVSADETVSQLTGQLDEYKGALFSSSYNFPGRYSRWDIGFINPPIELTAKGKTFDIKALNTRGQVILAYFSENLSDPAFSLTRKKKDELSGMIHTDSNSIIKEESRTKQPSVFSLLRQIQLLFHTNDDFLGLYGAFGFDLILQFEPFPLHKKRETEQNDLQLYLPDELIVVDREKSEAFKLSYDFRLRDLSTAGIERTGQRFPFRSFSRNFQPSRSFADKTGDYAKMVQEAKHAFKSGNLFEVVPSRILSKPCKSRPSEVFKSLQHINPSPYGFLIHLNNEEFLVGCSPEMFVRVDGATVETCPISGTIRRKGSVIEDAEQIKTLLGSAKEESELTMCTDVDRNDKSRVCVPGSVEVIGRRQIEAYSHLFHTVDHIKGLLKKNFDALDAFISHMWAVTITGAPKLEAIKWIEEHEKTPRGWYGGAVGWFGFNGNMNTGLTLRCLRLQRGTAQIRVGATLLYDSVPENEEQETLTKAGALVAALHSSGTSVNRNGTSLPAVQKSGNGLHILFVDHEDSFVHTLSSYFQTLGAKVTVCRSPAARTLIERGDEPIDLVVLSPGPGEPGRFHMNNTIDLCLKRHLPIFGICLGLQGIVSYFGGKLNILPVPAHGKQSVVIQNGESRLFKGIPQRFKAGRYHSICAAQLPSELLVSAETEDHVVMAVEHRSLPIAAVQFHPESIMTMNDQVGMKILENVLLMIDMQPALK